MLDYTRIFNDNGDVNGDLERKEEDKLVAS